MADGDVHPRAIEVFSHYYRQLESGETGVIAEDDVEPVTDLPRLDARRRRPARPREALGARAVIKLNGGLGTSMGMSRAKSLLPVRGDRSFLDVIALQVLAARERYGVRLPLLFMDSFRTRDDTLEALAALPRPAGRRPAGRTSCRTASPSCAPTT